MSSGRPRTLLWQLGLVLMVMQIAVMVALAWYAYDRLADFQHDQTRRDLERLMPILTDDYGQLIEREANDLINERARADGDRVGVRLTIILEDGTVIGDSMADPASMDDHRNRPEIARAFDEGAGTATRFSATLGTRMIYVARRVTTGQGNAAVVRTALAVDQVYEDFAPVVRAIGIAAALSVVLTLAVIYLVSRYYSEQIARVSEGAARFASGDLDHRIARLTTRELSTLAGSLNEMAGQLNQRLTELQRHQRSQRAILQSMSNGVLALDLDHRILEVNRAAERLLELDGDHARGRLLQETVRQPELHHLVASPTATPDRKPVEFVFAGERATRTLQAKRETLTDMDGAPRGLLVVIDDVTELRRLENLRSDFAANVSHELRTPITNIKGYVETLLETSTNGSDETARFLMVVKKNSDRLAAIVEDVLALTRLEEPQAREELDRQRTPIAAVLRSVVAQMSDAAAEKRSRSRPGCRPSTGCR